MPEHSYHVCAPLDPETGKPLCYCEQGRLGLPNTEVPTMPVWERPVDDFTIEKWRANVIAAYGSGPHLNRERLEKIYIEHRRLCMYGEPGVSADSVGRLIGEVMRLWDLHGEPDV